MKIAELIKISMEMLKMMSKSGIKTDDWRHLEMLDEYRKMRKDCEKFRYIMAYLSEKYRMSESSVRRIIKRLSGDVIL
jgi:ribosomal protein S25